MVPFGLNSRQLNGAEADVTRPIVIRGKIVNAAEPNVAGHPRPTAFLADLVGGEHIAGAR